MFRSPSLPTIGLLTVLPQLCCTSAGHTEDGVGDTGNDSAGSQDSADDGADNTSRANSSEGSNCRDDDDCPAEDGATDASDTGGDNSSTSSVDDGGSNSGDEGSSADSDTTDEDDATDSEGDEMCPSDQPLRCGDVCVNPDTDPLHCGTCNRVCEVGLHCSGGECQDLCGRVRDTQGGRSWQAQSRLIELDLEGFGQLETQLRSDGLGNATLAWINARQSEEAHVVAMTYDGAGEEWSAPTQLDTSSELTLNSGLALDLGARGQGMILWHAQSGTDDSQFATFGRSYDMATGQWGQALRMDQPSVRAVRHPNVKVDAQGNAFALWNQRTSDSSYGSDVYSNRYEAQRPGWRSASRISWGMSEGAESYAFDVNPSGDAIVVWSEGDDRGAIYAVRYDATLLRWEQIVTVHADPERWSLGSPSVGFTAEGDALAVWHEIGVTDARHFSARYERATDTWTTPEEFVAPKNGYADNELVVDDQGNATYVVSEYEDERVPKIWAIQYDAEAGAWAEPHLLRSFYRSLGEYLSRMAELSIDAAGNVFAAWTHDTYADVKVCSMEVARYDVEVKDWEIAECVLVARGCSNEPPHIVAMPDGEALSLWPMDGEGAGGYWISEYR